MNRFHVHVSVDDLAVNIRFYSTVFGQAPIVQKDDHAKFEKAAANPINTARCG